MVGCGLKNGGHKGRFGGEHHRLPTGGRPSRWGTGGCSCKVRVLTQGLAGGRVESTVDVVVRTSGFSQVGGPAGGQPE